ncbi:bacterial translation initiation factor 2 (bIF-2) [Limimonas halophila]|uniref:Translation initiation factor IF-2 n=1 Tax=Limimonas halophila TaxID=1082479 RepID=A0A1G7SL36_9PROT|nr:translation initiation factor IF-2 [Limimonas halophila]SDG23139.1 bacterial translation initiation factor 2 (bIF-2) [Limimonas halophila]
MTSDDKDDKKSDENKDGKLKLSGKKRGTLELNKKVEQGQVKQSFSHGRSKQVAVEVKRKRTYQRGESGRGQETAQRETAEAPARRGADQSVEQTKRAAHGESLETGTAETQTIERDSSGRQLTESERQARQRALEEARRQEEERKRRQAEEDERRRQEEAERQAELERRRQAEEEARRQLEAEEEERRRQKEAEEAAKAKEQPAEAEAGAESGAGEAAAEAAPAAEEAAPAAEAPEAKEQAPAEKGKGRDLDEEVQENLGGRIKKQKAAPAPKQAPGKRGGDRGRKKGQLTIPQALDSEEGERAPSLSATRRQRQRQKQRQRGEAHQPPKKVIREVVIPDSITVGELAQRMAVQAGQVVKTLMKLGTMATVNQTIDGETAQLVVEEFGHTPKRVSESDIEEGLETAPDAEADMQPRAPVVTVMGHVDHGKTSLLDALRKTDVVAGEAGGITQHIGAYQVVMPGGNKVSFIDTPGHAAFSEMRARGANITDIVILVVAADDGIKQQTVEAINHAKAAEVPMVVAINKCDKPDADPDRVRQELLNYGVVTEEMGGETLAVECSASSGEGLEQLAEALTLQAEIQDLKANPDRAAEGTVVEAKLEKGRGPVATFLVQRGTLKKGDTFVVGNEYGRARALVNDRGDNVEAAYPSEPVEVLGLHGTPQAGDRFVVVDSEQRAREIAEHRQEKARETQSTAPSTGSLEQMLARIKEGQVTEVPLVVKADVQGSLEAVNGALQKLGNEEVQPRVLHAGVGGITESDITLAAASNALVLGFNVRPNGKARQMAKSDGVDIRYFSVIYNLVDDVKALLESKLSPTARENFIGYADIRQVFQVPRVGNVAGCRVTEGVVRRNAGVRLLRDNVVIYEGTLKTLKRFKDDVKEVKAGYECGIALENHQDIREGDLIECYETQQVEREL